MIPILADPAVWVNSKMSSSLPRQTPTRRRRIEMLFRTTTPTRRPGSLQEWRDLAQSDPDRCIACGFQYGFPLGLISKPPPDVPGSASFKPRDPAAAAALHLEVGRSIAGGERFVDTQPPSSRPATAVIIPKATPGKFRFLQDASQYHHGRRTGVNSVIDHTKLPPVTQTSTREVMTAAGLAEDARSVRAHAYVCDAARYFRAIPVDWIDSASNLVRLPNGRILRDVRLGQGHCGSPAWATFISTRLAQVLAERCVSSFVGTSLLRFALVVLVYIDDMIAIGDLVDVDQWACMVFDLLPAIGINISIPKAREQGLPSRQVNYIGFHYDFDTRTISVPASKQAAALDQITHIRDNNSCTGSVLEQVVGKLSHLCDCLYVAKPFLRPLFEALSWGRQQAVDKQCDLNSIWIPLNFVKPGLVSAADALQFFQVALQMSGSRSFPRHPVDSSPQLTTDASVDGFGAELILTNLDGSTTFYGMAGTWPCRL